MVDFEPLLIRWEMAGLLDEETTSRIRVYENRQKRPAGLGWLGIVALTLGTILASCGVLLFVSAHWDELSPGARYVVVIGVVAAFHLAGAFFHDSYRGVSTALHAVGTISTGVAIALVGQIFNIQEHWPTAILLWALASAVGWVLLNDQAQEILTLLLLPAWILSEFSFHADNRIGEFVYQGRFLVVWAVLYLTIFQGTRRLAVRGVLFGAATIAGVTGIVLLLGGWGTWSAEQGFLPLGTRLWAWTVIALLPLFISCFRPLKCFIPVCVALLFSLALPSCTRTWTEYYNDHGIGPYTHPVIRTGPNLVAQVLVAAFAVFICWWGVRRLSRALVDLGIVAFAVAVGWFYFSDVYDEAGRSLWLIGLGVLFLAGGWALEEARRGILVHMKQKGIWQRGAHEAP